MQWRKSKRDSTRTSLLGDVLTDVARHSGRPSWVTEEQVLRDTLSPRFATVVYTHDGASTIKPTKTAYVPAITFHPRTGRATPMGIGWNGELLTVMSAVGSVDSWTPRPGGLLPEHRGDPERTPVFPVRGQGTRSSGQIAEIAAVTSPEYAFWLLFLDERGHQLADIPVAGFDEPRLLQLVDAAGLSYRRYLLEVDWTVIPMLLSTDYFPGKPAPTPGSTTPVELGLWLSGHPQA